MVFVPPPLCDDTILAEIVVIPVFALETAVTEIQKTKPKKKKKYCSLVLMQITIAIIK